MKIRRREGEASGSERVVYPDLLTARRNQTDTRVEGILGVKVL